MCCYRDLKNYERFNLVVQSIICLTVCQLKNIQQLIDRHLAAIQPTTPADGVAKVKNNNPPLDDGKTSEHPSPPKNDEIKTVAIDETTVVKSNKPVDDSNEWHLPELEKLLILVSKAFLLNFPLYIAYKHGVHSRLDDITAQEAQVWQLFSKVLTVS